MDAVQTPSPPTIEKRRWDVLVVGDPCADVVLRVDHVPAMGKKVLGHPLGTFAGGTEANVACTSARLGMSSAVFGRVGDDAHAALLVRGFIEAGVCTEHLSARVAARSACAFTLLDPSGERAIVYQPMTNDAMELSTLGPALAQACAVYTMPYDLDVFLEISRLARCTSTLVAIDIEAAVAPTPSDMRKRVEAADIVFFNEEGFRAGTGERAEPPAIASLLTAGPRLIVVSLGAKGAVAMDRSGFASQAAFATDVVDTTGAGDTFNAAFLAAHVEGAPLHDALRFACAAASCTVGAMGARGGLPSRAQVEAIAGPLPHPRSNREQPC